MAKIQENAKRVFKGEIFEVWQWDQELYDGTKKVFEAAKRPNTVQIVTVKDDKIVLLTEEQPHRKEPYISLPGGRCEATETPLESAKRELAEETGLISADWSLWTESNPVNKLEWTIYTFVARNCQEDRRPELDPGEKISVKYLDFEEFISLCDDEGLNDRSLRFQLLKAKYDPAEKAKLHKLLFGL